METDGLEENKNPKEADKATNDTKDRLDKAVINNSSTKNRTVEVVDHEEDDVPGDFFDDFLKEDFMAGLDIVDEDESEEKGDNAEASGKKSKDKESAKSSDLRRMLNNKEKRISETDLRNVLKGKDSQKAKPPEMLRRDPNKTRRDIERDKVKCERDKEKKIISEKLKLVETGLVPPGMEMETDLEEIKIQKQTMQSNNGDPTAKNDHRSSSTKNKRSTSSKKIGSTSESSPKRSSRRLSRSPKRRAISPLRIRRSPIRRSPFRRRSRTRSRERPSRSSRERHIIRSLEKSLDRSISRSKERSPRRGVDRSKERSPRRRSPLTLRLDDRKRSRSRDKYKYSPRRRRSRSVTPRRRRDFDRKKKSFLEEIAEKLNETRPAVYQPVMQPYAMPHNMVPNAIPGPVPAPMPVPNPMMNQFHPQQQQFDLYDQSFFIGTSVPQISPVTPAICHTPVVDNKTNLQPMLVPEPKTQEDFTKLFQDKKITLTEFLSMTAKPEVYSTSTEQMKEKIKVISRCQDAIKYLESSEKKLYGPLIVRKSSAPKPSPNKHKSPLLRTAELRLPFTEIPKSGEDHRADFTGYIDGLLRHLGLADDDDVVIVEEDAPPAPSISSARRRPDVASKWAQTEAPRCQECERRKNTKRRSVGTQCGADGVSFSVGTQVSDDDFGDALPRSRSLAALTPAQLLARSGVSQGGRSVEDDDVDLMFPQKTRPPGSYQMGGGQFQQMWGGGRMRQQPPPSRDAGRFFNNLY
ncbi:unnamed protein product [Phyllotreta striolata]|uniref:Uncharacterized protein n=1 Tax=Phyllotreta striolata TaxID=444603 RepID=A0A9N9XRI3_PHYSR|nr:unnamed protein product [Phyllotreta striolata]